MLLQKVIYTDSEICNETEMFFKGVSSNSIKDNCVILKANEQLSLNTYFNSFSIGKWTKYTNLSNLQFQFIADCNCTVKAFHSTASINKKEAEKNYVNKYISVENKIENNKNCISVTKKEISTTLEVKQTAAKYQHTVNIPKLYDDGLIYIDIIPEIDTEITEAGWYTEIADEQLNKIKFAIGICTYKREEYLKKNVSKINNQLINNQESCLFGKIEVYVADNGQTLPVDYFNSKFIHIYPNINLGGASGFTRTMIESIINDKNKNFSHVILTDDDIVLSTDVLERTYQFLCLLKPEYSNSMLGGAMLLENERNIQFENGGIFDGTSLFRAHNSFFDLSQECCITANLTNDDINYQGWWYCCIPASIISNSNLPLPFFIHCDDIEYGLRNSNNEIILINGICVWHPSFVNKSSLWTFYYDIRNYLILTTLKERLCNKKTVLISIIKYYARSSLFHQHIKTEILNKAISDFMKGADFFINQDAELLQKQLCQYKYTFITPNELNINIQNCKILMNYDTPPITALKQLLLCLLPFNNKIKVYSMEEIKYLYVGKRIYAYDSASNTGILFEKNIKKAFKLNITFWTKFVLLFFNFTKLKKDFQNNEKILTSSEFWNKYLKL